MRTLFIIPLILLSLVSFPSWGLTMGDLVERGGLYYNVGILDYNVGLLYYNVGILY